MTSLRHRFTAPDNGHIIRFPKYFLKESLFMFKKYHPKLNKAMILTIMALAWPTMLEQLMQTAVQYIDTAMVGSLGTQATAAVGATTTVNWLIGSSISALSIGFLAFIAKAHGAGDEEGARRAVGQAALAVLVTGTVFTILTLSLSGLIPVWMQVDPHIQDLAARYFFILYLPMLPRAASIIFGTVLRAAGDPHGEITWAPRGNHVGPTRKSRGPHVFCSFAVGGGSCGVKELCAFSEMMRFDE